MQQDTEYIAEFAEFTRDIQKETERLLYEFNRSSPDEEESRAELLKKLFRVDALNIVIKPPFHCDYGFNIHFDGFAFVNYNCTVLDTSPVHFGENIFIAPNVCIACAGHALHPDERLLFNTSKPIRIEKNVWLGTNTAVLPGVVIGEGCVIGAGSIVTKDIPPFSIAAGNPCRVLRKISDADKISRKRCFSIL